MNYLVLAQHAQRPGGELKYLDVEGGLYHYPRQYFSLINGYEPFLYYRPQRGASISERSAYVGYGRLLDWFPDPERANCRYVRIENYRQFARPVSFEAHAGLGDMYESGFSSRNQFQGRSVRRINDPDYMRILAAAGIYGEPFSAFRSVDDELPFSLQMLDRLTRIPPTQPLHAIDSIPEGAGYIPTGRLVDLRESAGLQERARADHQAVLKECLRIGVGKGAMALYNNNVDLVLTQENARILIEAKSLNDDRSAVDRMRYGMGQLLDYGVRYRAELAGAQPLLAFGRIPRNDVGWVAEILEANHIGFAGMNREAMVPLNESARQTFLFA